MMNMIKNVMGVGHLNDQVIATDLLIAAKSAVRNYAYALTETATPEVRNILITHLNDAIYFHDQVAKYMSNKGYYHVYDLTAQLTQDVNNAEKTINMTQYR